MTDPDKIDTVEKARDLSLIKWSSIKEHTVHLWDEINSRCGFCFCTDKLTGKMFICTECPVKKKCDEVSRTSSNIEASLIGMIDDVLIFLGELKIDDN